MKPEISLIMSVYNGEEYLKEAVESVINQTFKEWELIIINDCSTDNTAGILSELAERDERISVHTNEVNLKLPASLNKAISLSKGKYIARMDADDICLPERLEKQFEFMEKNPDVSLSSCRFMTLKNGALASGGCGGKCDSESLKALLLVTNPILHPGIIARAEVISKLMYDTSLTCTEDLELWTRFAAENYKMEILPEYLMLYRLHDKQITGTTLERQHKEALKIQQKYYGAFLEEMSEETENFYINGVYFRDMADTDKFIAFCKWVKGVNRKTKGFDKKALNYALFEILAEYKRCGIPKAKLIKAILSFDLIFAATELYARKKRAAADGRKCIEAAEKIGYIQSGGTPECPVFSGIEK